MRHSLRRGDRPFRVTGGPGKQKYLLKVQSKLYEEGCKFVHSVMSGQLWIAQTCPKPDPIDLDHKDIYLWYALSLFPRVFHVFLPRGALVTSLIQMERLDMQYT